MTTRRLRTRTLQRALHLLTGAVVMYAVYVPPAADAPLGIAVRFVLLPGLVVSGLAMWKWTRVRRRMAARFAAARTARQAV